MSTNKSKSKDSSKSESKAKQAQDAYPENKYVGSQLQFGEEIRKMFGVLFQRQVATLFNGFKDNSFYLSEKFMYLQDNHVKKCQWLIDFMKTKIQTVQQQMNIQKGADLETSNKEEQIKKLYKEIFKDNKQLNNTFIELLAPTPTNLTGDFDLMIEGVHKFQVLHDKIIKNFQKKSIQESNKIWVIQNYLELDRKENQWTRSIFELKRHLFTEKYNKQCSATKLIQESEIQERQKKEKQIIDVLKMHAQKVKNMDQFLKYLEDSTVFRTLTQLMKVALAGKFYNLNAFADRMKSMDIQDFENMKSFTCNKEDLPIIDIYLVINSNIKQQQFKSCFDFFKPILRYWFDSVGAFLHVIGFTKRSKHEINIQKELQKQGNQIEVLKENQKNVREQNLQLRAKLNLQDERIKILQERMNKLLKQNEKKQEKDDKNDKKEDKK